MSDQASDPRIRVWVEFNDIDNEGDVVTLQSFAAQRLGLGDPVLAWNHEGTQVNGIVKSISGQEVLIHLHGDEKPCDLCVFVPTPDGACICRDQSYCDFGYHQQCSGYTNDEADPESCMCDCHDEVAE